MNTIYTKKFIAEAASNAVQDQPPAAGTDYPFVQQLKSDHEARIDAHDPFREEKVRAKMVCASGIAISALTPVILGWSYLSIFITLIGLLTAFIGGWEAFFKPWPAEVTDATIDQSRRQLEAAGETGQRLSGPVAKALYGALCVADGALAGTALAERLGQASLTPRMAMLIGLVFSVALAAALFSAIKAAARESQKAKARQMVRNLQKSDPAKAISMEARIGDTLGFAYGPRDDSKKARIGLITLTGFMALTQFGLRLGGFADEANATSNISNWIAAITVSALIFFTVAGMYVSECRHMFLDEDSPHSKTILGKFPDAVSLGKHKGAHAVKLKRETQDTIRAFVQHFNAERAATNAAKSHPTPNLVL